MTLVDDFIEDAGEVVLSGNGIGGMVSHFVQDRELSANVCRTAQKARTSARQDEKARPCLVSQF